MALQVCVFRLQGLLTTTISKQCLALCPSSDPACQVRLMMEARPPLYQIQHSITLPSLQVVAVPATSRLPVLGTLPLTLSLSTAAISSAPQSPSDPSASMEQAQLREHDVLILINSNTRFYRRSVPHLL